MLQVNLSIKRCKPHKPSFSAIYLIMSPKFPVILMKHVLEGLVNEMFPGFRFKYLLFSNDRNENRVRHGMNTEH